MADRAGDAFELAARIERRRQGESAQAAVLIEAFARDAAAAGLVPERLLARSYSGTARFRTNVTGWYIKRDHSIGVSTDGKFYLLHAPASLSARVKGVLLEPADPPLELGRGARDGESMPLTEALSKRLEAGNEF